MDQSETTPSRVGIKIEGPSTQKIGSIFSFLLVTSLIFVLFTMWLLALEWIGKPLPAFLKLPINF